MSYQYQDIVYLWVLPEYLILYMPYLYPRQFTGHAVKYEFSFIFQISSLLNAQQMSFLSWVERIPHITTLKTNEHLVYVLITNLITGVDYASPNQWVCLKKVNIDPDNGLKPRTGEKPLPELMVAYFTAA